MALVHFDHNLATAPIDAVDLHTVTPAGGGAPYVVWKTHLGLCLRDWERNGYDDSDFFMTIWDYGKNAPRDVCFASTRGWTYPSMGSGADATPEVEALYTTWLANERARTRVATRHQMARELVKFRNTARNVFGGHYIKALKLRRTMGDAPFAIVLKLMKKRARGNFTKSLQKQVAQWLDNPAPKYPTPLSSKQLAAIY